MSAIILRVLVVCLPIFAVLALGYWLRQRGTMSGEAHTFINGLVYRYSLPLIIFREVARQDFGELMVPGIIGGSLIAMAAGGTLFWLGARLLGLPREQRAVIAITPFWANLSYLGFPLAAAAFPEQGLGAAAVVNAFGMPAGVLGGMALLAISTGERVSWGEQIKRALLNPVVVAGFSGVAVAAIASQTPLGDAVTGQPVLAAGLETLDSLLLMLGGMGLPLALIAVGASLAGGSLAGQLPALAWGSFGKLVLTPAIALGIVWWCFPETSAAAAGTTVLLMATPGSVAAYVIAQQMGGPERFLASHLVLSTVLSMITIPLWLLLLYSL